jgi:20S proteasome subunit beta 5
MASVLNKYLPIDPPDPLATDEDLALLSPSSLPTFSLPQVANPTTFLRAHIDDHVNPDCRIKLAHGTTTLAFRFDGGIVVAVDSRATAGSWIASQTVKKGITFWFETDAVIEINKFLLGTMAGGAADCQFWYVPSGPTYSRETYLGKECRLHELRNKERISVAAASKILSNIVYGYKGMGLSMVCLLFPY